MCYIKVAVSGAPLARSMSRVRIELEKANGKRLWGAAAVISENGCVTCHSCGWSKCAV